MDIIYEGYDGNYLVREYEDGYIEYLSPEEGDHNETG